VKAHGISRLAGRSDTKPLRPSVREEGFRLAKRTANFNLMTNREETIMAWTTPTLVEICVGLEINGYLPAEF
jgi:coenzyme PQQ precursor peptide PqqA